MPLPLNPAQQHQQLLHCHRQPKKQAVPPCRCSCYCGSGCPAMYAVNAAFCFSLSVLKCASMKSPGRLGLMLCSRAAMRRPRGSSTSVVPRPSTSTKLCTSLGTCLLPGPNSTASWAWKGGRQQGMRSIYKGVSVEGRGVRCEGSGMHADRFGCRRLEGTINEATASTTLGACPSGSVTQLMAQPYDDLLHHQMGWTT